MNRTKPVTLAMVGVLAMGTLGAVGATRPREQTTRTRRARRSSSYCGSGRSTGLLLA
jgi:hypothetical protein